MTAERLSVVPYLTLSDSHCDPNRQTPFRVIEIGAVDGRVCQVLDVVNVNFK